MLKANLVIETKRLVLRPLQPSDAAMITLYASDARVARHLSTLPHPYPPGAAELFIEYATNPETSEIIWAIEKDGQLIGVISLRDDGDLGYWLAPQLWGGGFTSEALGAVIKFAQQNGFGQLLAKVHQGNDASARVLIKNGFEYTGDGESYAMFQGNNVVHWQYMLRVYEGAG